MGKQCAPETLGFKSGRPQTTREKRRSKRGENHFNYKGFLIKVSLVPYLLFFLLKAVIALINSNISSALQQVDSEAGKAEDIRQWVRARKGIGVPG